jgi:hypothetical protein
MRREKVNFQGIIRNTSDQTPIEGACEELINLRSENGSLRVIGGKRVILSNKTYSRVIEHISSSFNNLIVVIGNKVYQVDRTTGTPTQIHSCPSVNIELSTLNNMLIINCAEATKLVVYQYKAGAYSLLFNGLPAMALIQRFELEEGDTKVNASSKFSTGLIDADVPFEASVIRDFKEKIGAAINEARNLDLEFCEGYILVSSSYTLFDGSETKMSPPTLYKLGAYNETPIRVEWGGSMRQNVWVNIQVERLYLGIGLPANYAQFSDILKYVNIYCSRPISYYKATLDGITLNYDINNTLLETSEVAPVVFNEALFLSELMYKCHQIEINSIEEKYQIKFGDEILTGKTMPVDSSGWVSVVGKPFVYNNRLHLFDIKKTLTPDPEVFMLMSLAETLPLPTTTAAPGRVSEEYYSHSIISSYNAWEVLVGQPRPVIGTLWYDLTDGNYYTTENGSTLVDPGWYLVNYGEPYSFSTIRAIRIGEIEDETTSDGTSSEGTTSEGTTEIGTTQEGTSEEGTTDAETYATVVTYDAANIGAYSAEVSGAVTSEGGSPVTESGIVYSTSDEPTTADTKVGVSFGLGLVGATILFLEANTTYNFRAYAINSAGTAYGGQKSFVTEPVSELTTTEEGTTEIGTTSPGTTIAPPEPIVCNGFDAYAQNDADTRILSNNYNTVALYVNLVGGNYIAYADDEFTTFAQEGYYAVGTYVFGVERRIQIGASGVPLYDSDGILVSGTTEEGTTEEPTTPEPTTESGTTEEPTTAPGTTDEGTTASGTTEEDTTEPGTTSAGTTDAPRAANAYYGYSATSASDCFTSNLTGTIWSDPNDDLWYTTEEGSTLIADGYWMFEKNSGVEDSVIYQFINGTIQ